MVLDEHISLQFRSGEFKIHPPDFYLAGSRE